MRSFFFVVVATYDDIALLLGVANTPTPIVVWFLTSPRCQSQSRINVYVVCERKRMRELPQIEKKANCRPRAESFFSLLLLLWTSGAEQGRVAAHCSPPTIVFASECGDRTQLLQEEEY